MKATIRKSEVAGRAKAPASKSYTIRGLMCAALACGESRIVDPLVSDDTGAASDVLGWVGVDICRDAAVWRVSGGDFHQPGADLYCGDSAATLRFMTAICSLVPGSCHLVVGPSLARRPVRPLVQALQQLGVDASCRGEVAPVTVRGGGLRGGTAELPGNISSQFVSALLLAAPCAEQGVALRLTTKLESRPYVMMTLECLKTFGIEVLQTGEGFRVERQSYQPATYRVEGDWSSASYFLALGAVSGEVTVENLNPASLQGDRVLLDFLREMGALVELGDNSVTVRRSVLKAIDADLTDCIDLLPTVAVLAAAADGTSRFTGIDRARLKESDRVAAVREGLEAMGIKVAEGKNSLAITGSPPKGVVVDSHGDHRIAMAFSILGTLYGGVTVAGAECVSKTFPRFWDILREIGGRVEAA
ncbi:MAG: 3-phosphoshikimate 1-carboxyvinyltransferase [Chloroflexota bacterium]